MEQFSSFYHYQHIHTRAHTLCLHYWYKVAISSCDIARFIYLRRLDSYIFAMGRFDIKCVKCSSVIQIKTSASENAHCEWERDRFAFLYRAINIDSMSFI